MRKNIFLLLTALMLLTVCCSSSAGNDAPADNGQAGGSAVAGSRFSGTWVTNVGSPVLFSRDAIRQCVATCKAYGIGNIFVCVWNKGQTLYPSDLMERETGIRQLDGFDGRDPLREMVEEAHKEGIKVHAWFEYGFASGNGQVGPLLTAHPEWAARDNSGRQLVKNNFYWMNAFMPEVQEFMLGLVKEVVRGYDVDGVQGDDRLPALPVEGGYDDYTVSLYRSENGDTPPQNHNDAAWVNWRCDKLTQFQGRLYKEVKAIKPAMTVSCAPSPYSFAKDSYLQDWPTWLEKGYADYVIPQVYRYNINDYKRAVSQQAQAVSSALRDKLYVGVLIKNGDYSVATPLLRSMVEANRSNSIKGECFWYYDGLRVLDDYFSNHE